jgi:hypothetical protein
MGAKEKAAGLRAEAARHEANAAESWERSDTDGFLSQWASGINAQKARAEADIAEAGGIATFSRYVLEDLEGNAVAAKLINGRYGLCWALEDAAGKFTGEFITAHPARAATLERKGYREREEEFVAEATASIAANGTGLSGAATARVITRPKDTKVRYDRVIGLGDLTGEED